MYPTGFKITTEPTVEPVSVNDLADELRLDDDQNIPSLAILAKAARIAVERATRRALINQTITAVWDCWPKSGDWFTLERAPFSSLTTFQYLNTSKVWTDVTSTYYSTDSVTDPARIFVRADQSWPENKIDEPASVKAVYVAGYGATKESVPDALRQAIMSIAIDLYEHPEMQPEIALKENRAVKIILDSYTMPLVK